MFGSTQGFGDAATQATQKATKQEDKQTCIPVTARVIHDAAAKHAESQELLIHGSEASIVNMVGVVEGLSAQPTVIEFQLNDSTGRVKVRHYSTGNGDLSIPGLENGKYVSVVGNLRTTPAAHVSAMTLRLVTTPDEVSYHMIDVAHACLQARDPNKAMGLGKPTADVFSAVKPAAPAVQPAATTGADLHSSVVKILTEVQESGSQEGLSVSALASRLSADGEKVRTILAKMVDDGDAFTTVDENHFAIV